MEERFIYPIVAERLGSETESEAEIEHGLTRDGLDKLDELVDEPGFGAALVMLESGVGHHVHEEENEVFPELREKAVEALAPLDPQRLEAEVREEPDSDEMTRDELYEKAQEADISGRSSMNKEELAQSLAENR
ncbi:MAG TPA: hemerythrin domain-containing protein [Acidimicrobiales bacterium]|nr:hemerythrin domain-containing protein [Acidimicrobiales bacterium]